jgi:hypothetical protein
VMAVEIANAVRNECADIAWAHFMDTCAKLRVPPHDFSKWSSAKAIRDTVTKPPAQDAQA